MRVLRVFMNQYTTLRFLFDYKLNTRFFNISNQVAKGLTLSKS